METPNVPVTFGIGRAIKEMQNGFAVTRASWNGKNQFLRLQVPDEMSTMSLPYVYITTVQGDRVPWLCSQTDLLALDWQLHTPTPTDATPTPTPSV